jgi:hypothetical protein
MSEIWTRMMKQEPDRDWQNASTFAQHWADVLGLDEQHAGLSAGLLAKEYGETERRIGFAENERWATAQALTVLSASPSYQTV